MSYSVIREEIFAAVTNREYMNPASEKRIVKILYRVLVSPGNYELDEIYRITEELSDSMSENVIERIHSHAHVISLIKE